MLIPQFVQAAHYQAASRSTIDWIVVHTMEAPCVSGMAQRCAQGFAKGDREASAHYCCDPANILQSVREADIAWHCKSDATGTVNRLSIGVEHAGYTLGNPTDWMHDPHAQGMMDLSAQLVADLCSRYGVPVVHLTVEQIQAGERGIIAHVDATHAFNVPGGHVDGSTWPWEQYLPVVQALLRSPAPEMIS
jgi:N-acetyl-anhydromuramyl-L-alanine amidase AmpD